MAKIYLASSWRNPWQPTIVTLLRDSGHEVYDFRNPGPGSHGFAWHEVDEKWRGWTLEQYRDALKDPIAEAGFRADMDGLEWCDTCILAQPCGTSSHLELGWACGQRKRTAVLFPGDDIEPAWRDAPLRSFEPELMPKMVDAILIGKTELLSWLG